MMSSSHTKRAGRSLARDVSPSNPIRPRSLATAPPNTQRAVLAARSCQGVLFRVIIGLSALASIAIQTASLALGDDQTGYPQAVGRGVRLSTRPRVQPPSQRASAVDTVRHRNPLVGRPSQVRQASHAPGNPSMSDASVGRDEIAEGDLVTENGAPFYPDDSIDPAVCESCGTNDMNTSCDGAGCDELASDPGCAHYGMLHCTRWSAGVEFTFLQPHFETNPAILRQESNNAGLDTLSETEFDYGTPLSPRVWLETMQGDQLGFRLTYWQFDQAAEGITQSPPANGLGRIQPPPFGNIDLSTTTAGSTLSAGADLNAYTIDVEATECFNTGLWGWLGTAGIRYGEVDQGYQARLVNAAANAQGRIDFRHRVQGVGPTMSLRTSRPFLRSLSVFGLARGSLLFGDGELSLSAVEDQDLANPLTTNRSVDRDDLLPIGEIQLGLQYTPFCGSKQPYIHLAMEGQVWHGAGSASSEDGSLGFFGLNVALGFDW